MTNPTDFLRLYTEFYTQSVTTEPPTFSLFEDRKLALGYRKLVAQGMTYYTDLLQFIGAQNQPWPLSSYGLQKTPNGKLPKGTEYLERENRIVHDLVKFFGSEEAISQLRIDDQCAGRSSAKNGFFGTGKRMKMNGSISQTVGSQNLVLPSSSMEAQIGWVVLEQGQSRLGKATAADQTDGEHEHPPICFELTKKSGDKLKASK